MSHFTVGVILDDLNDLESILEKYDEEKQVEPYISMTKDELEDEFKAEDDISWDEFIEDKNLDSNGNLLSTYNPNSKWDWWVIGGRWGNVIRLKTGERANYAKIKDIDFSLDMTVHKEAERFWELVVEGLPLKDGEEMPVLFYKPKYYLDMYETKENYANNIASFNTFALIYNGEWYEEGEMGWWGISNTTKDSLRNYKELFSKIISGADPEDYFVIVDCHI